MIAVAFFKKVKKVAYVENTSARPA